MVACACAVALSLWLTPVGAVADDLEAYLSRPGLEHLLATHLEERLAATRNPQDREGLARRIAETLTVLLDRTREPDEISTIERRSEALLEHVTGLANDELRLALIAARHRNAARTIEMHRLRSVDADAVAAASEAFGRLLPELERLDRALSEALRAAQTRTGRAGGADGGPRADRADRLARLATQAAYLRAWAIYYRALAGRERGRSDDAILLFARVLELPTDRLRAEDASLSLMESESYARAALGMTLAQGLRRPDVHAREWLELLADEATHPAVRGELPAWRMVVLLDADPPRYAEVSALVEALLEDEPEMPAAWLKLAAARGLEGAADAARAPDRLAAQRLASRAVTALAVRGEVAHVLELARRYGGDALGEEGFVVRYVRGVERFEAARGIHDGEEPATDPQALELFAAASEELTAALASPDAADVGDGIAACRSLLGWASYYRDRLGEAVEHFLAAAEVQRPSDAAESRWMAIAALDRIVRRDPNDPVARQGLEEAIDMFLAEHPSSPRAGRLVLRRALVAEPSRRTVRELESVPEGSDAHVGAQRQALHVLYRLIRAASDDEERAELSREFMLRVLPMIDDDDRRIADGDDSLRDGRIVRIRQAIEVSLTPQVDRPAVARELVGRLGADPEAAETHAAEIALRLVQIAAAEDDLAGAERAADRLAELASAPGAEPAVREWYVTAARVLFRTAMLHWRRDGAIDRPGPLAAIERWGAVVIERPLAIENPEDRRRALRDPQILPYLSGTAEASIRRWRLVRDPDGVERTEVLLRTLLDLRSDDESAVRWLSILLEETGRLEPALELVRRLVAGTRSDSERWFEARWRQIDILRRLDPQRAHAVMRQHRTLHPEYGPEPWGERLRRLDERLRIEHPESGGVST